MPGDRNSQPPSSPTAELLDLLGRRWTLRILWALRDGSLSFGEVRAHCDGMSASVLTQRLTDLQEARLIEPEPTSGYRLTAAGASLLGQMRFVDEWASSWGKAFRQRAPS